MKLVKLFVMLFFLFAFIGVQGKTVMAGASTSYELEDICYISTGTLLQNDITIIGVLHNLDISYDKISFDIIYESELYSVECNVSYGLSIIEGNIYIVDSNGLYLYLLDNISSEFIFEDDDNEGGTSEQTIYDGSSFESAIEIDLNTTMYRYATGDPIYYKISTNNSELLIYSIVNSVYYPIDIYLYNNTQALVNYSIHDSSQSVSISQLTVKDNYYIKIVPYSYYNNWISFDVEENVDCSCINDPELLNLYFGYTAVNTYNNTLYWYSNSIYDSEIRYAVNVWNSLGIVQFVEAINTYTVFIYDANINSLGVFTPIIDTIKLNIEYFENSTFDERVHVILHELGHALGLNDFNNTWYTPQIIESEKEGNIMVQGDNENIVLYECDLYMYYYIWK